MASAFTSTPSPLWANSVRRVTGLIYVVIIGLWVAVLVPMWLKRHDQVSEVRSTARFHHAMQSLGSHRDDHRYADYRDSRAGSRGSASRTAPNARRNRLAESDMPRTPYRSLSPRQQAMAIRRAIILASLSGVLAITLVLAIAGIAPRWLPIIFAIPVAGFLVAATMTAAERSASAGASSSRSNSTSRRTQRDLRQEMDDAIAATKTSADDDWENWNAWDDDDAWEAVPQTLPTYVGAPRASAIPRPIDRSRPGEWTGEAMVEAAQSMQTMRRHATRFEDVDARAETAEIPVVVEQPRRAVNE